jgi:hypothetical protein
MGDELETSERYRDRARDLRNLASNKSHSAIRDHLLSIADQYDRLAAMLVDIDATNVAVDRAAAMTPPKTT